MPTYRPYVPNAYSLSPQMLGGAGLDLAGGGFSLAKAATMARLAAPVEYAGSGYDDLDGEGLDGEGFGRGTQRKVMKYGAQGAKIAERLVNQFGDDDQKRNVASARRMADVISGEGFGSGTQRKVMQYGKQGAHIAEALIGQFGTDSQKQKAATARKVADTISGGGSRATSSLPAAHLRAMAAQGVAHF